MSAIDRLRHHIGNTNHLSLVSAHDTSMSTSNPEAAVSLGYPPFDTALGGGLKPAVLHEVTAARPLDIGAATGFCTALVHRVIGEQNRLSAPLVWIQQRYGMQEGGRLYGTGLQQLDIAPDSLLTVRVSRPVDALWAMEEALSSGMPLVIGEMAGEEQASLTATRRLTLAAEAGGGLGLLLFHKPRKVASAALTRWQIRAASGLPDQYGGLGLPCFEVSLIKNRHGSCGRWLVHWNHHEHSFISPEQRSASISGQTLSRGFLPVPRDGQDRKANRAGADSARLHRIAS